MCNRYEAPRSEAIASHFGRGVPPAGYGPFITPLKPAPYVIDGAVRIGQWGLIPPTSPTRVPAAENGQRLSTTNARRERLATARSFRAAWKAGTRCLIPVDAFDEPCWETGRNVWWRFWRADGTPWALAGLWTEWTDKVTGEVVPSFTMITQNCDGHPLLARMHKPDLKLPEDQQDKRTVVPVARDDWDLWLHGSTEQVQGLFRVPSVDVFRAGPLEGSVQQGSLL